ncbi:MAG: hypothetical protein JSV56_11800 [Methanomassiliicoccales archaeon]|nr:MAG: hypothetical protein JSV56_11800 [Methanomassiliicoccales archaeon]
MQNKVEVHGKTFLKETVELISGERGATDVDSELLPLLEAIDNPNELPFLLDKLNTLEPTEDLRLALVRVQVQSDLFMHEDLNLHQKRLYVAQTIEKLLWGELLLDGGGDKKKKDEDKK